METIFGHYTSPPNETRPVRMSVAAPFKWYIPMHMGLMGTVLGAKTRYFSKSSILVPEVVRWTKHLSQVKHKIKDIHINA